MISNHSYISIRECIADFLAKGHMPAEIPDELPSIQKKHTDSRYCQIIKSKAQRVHSNLKPSDFLIITAVTWSDDFEPNNSNKSNRGSVWIKTLTFLMDSERNTIDATYPLCIASKSANHEAVEKLYVKELQELSTGKNNIFYSMNLKKYVHVHFELIMSLGDQPERRNMNYIMLGNSSFASRFRHSCNISEIQEFMPPCNSCYFTLKYQPEHQDFISNCNSCLCWDVTNKKSFTRSNPPKNYPDDMVPSNNKISHKEITFKELRNAINTAQDRYISGQWNEKNVQSFCIHHTINTNGFYILIEHSNNVMIWKI